MGLVDRATALVAKHEGFRQFPYRDTVGKMTVGYGRNLVDKGILPQEAAQLLRNDVLAAIDGLQDKMADVWGKLNETRQAVLVDMAVNMGVEGVIGFKEMRVAMGAGDWQGARLAMLDSKWAGQVGLRAKELGEMMEKGG